MFGASHSSPLQAALGGLLAFGALNAFAGGYYGLTGAEDVPTEWLSGSPFKDYFIPSLFLVTVIGGSLLAATVAVFARLRRARVLAIGAGFMLLAWIVVQVAMIGYVSWMQPATAIGACLVLVLAWKLPTPTASQPGKRPQFVCRDGNS